LATFRSRVCELFHEVAGRPKSTAAAAVADPQSPFASPRFIDAAQLLAGPDAARLRDAERGADPGHRAVHDPSPTERGEGQPYESGIAPLGDARERVSVKFYLVAMLFIVFDIETVFMIPWGVHFRQLSCDVPMVMDACPAGHLSFFGLGEMLVFAAILVVGFAYVWKKGALTWD
jgi:NADH-quinone oxidoreductase subunit A